ncbi:hypothetical protein KIN20_035317 [Parelaphostrongylus tenuis]|uniref:Uncharacterized protein n=1 Tax=Parelaphostrongylus tenuis TaxID=148309 RepID=A0AAD5RB94_PARTN|nr:hypothetical protein KIN20_035317 [Parelaphostrongylus tenuis]
MVGSWFLKLKHENSIDEVVFFHIKTIQPHHIQQHKHFVAIKLAVFRFEEN